jgi:DnaK suppressor protein
LESSVYGTCERCDKSIGVKRLEALPLALFCRDCQDEMEMAQRREREMGL